MTAIEQDISSRKLTLEEFKATAISALTYLSLSISGEKVKDNYKLHFQTHSGHTKWLRPINQNLFIYDPVKFSESFVRFQELLVKMRLKGSEYTETDLSLIDSVLYTIQQSIGCCFDLVANANSGRKHVGNRFEELMRVMFDELSITNIHHVLRIPYKTEDGKKIYSCEMDLVISPFSEIKSSQSKIHDKEIVVSVKTTSKDRMGKMFMDKILMEQVMGHKQKVVGIFLNDVQRNKENSISYTLVSNLFMVYTHFITPLEGVYYLDPPPNAYKAPFDQYMKPFSHLVTKDIWDLLSS